MKIKKGDNVILISGKDRGKKGKVLRVFPVDERILVEGVNIHKKHMRAKKQGEKGQIIEQPAPLYISNAKLVCPKCGKPARIGFIVHEKKKYRMCKICKGEF